jgi:hypothetical protein
MPTSCGCIGPIRIANSDGDPSSLRRRQEGAQDAGVDTLADDTLADERLADDTLADEHRVDVVQVDGQEVGFRADVARVDCPRLADAGQVDCPRRVAAGRVDYQHRVGVGRDDPRLPAGFPFRAFALASWRATDSVDSARSRRLLRLLDEFQAATTVGQGLRNCRAARAMACRRDGHRRIRHWEVGLATAFPA